MARRVAPSGRILACSADYRYTQRVIIRTAQQGQENVGLDPYWLLNSQIQEEYTNEIKISTADSEITSIARKAQKCKARK